MGNQIQRPHFWFTMSETNTIYNLRRLAAATYGFSNAFPWRLHWNYIYSYHMTIYSSGVQVLSEIATLSHRLTLTPPYTSRDHPKYTYFPR